MKPLYLYSTPGCHLCEMAREIIEPLLGDHSLILQEIDIADSDDLIERYGVKIPVLKSPQHIDELCWPFDSAQVVGFLQRNSI